MKKMFLIIIAAIFVNLTLFAGDNSFFKGGDIDVPFFKSFFINKEEYVKQELLKCKDVEAVEMKVSYQDEDDLFYEIHVYLTNHRFLSFDWVDLSFYKSSQTNTRDYITLKQINDLAFIEQSFKPCRLGKDSFVYAMYENFGEIRFLNQLATELKAGNMLEIIENISDVYDYIKNLPKKPENSSPQRPEFEGFYENSFKLPEEFDNGIPVSAVVRKKVVDRQASTENWYEEAYKFYKLPIKEAKNQNIYISDY